MKHKNAIPALLTALVCVLLFSLMASALLAAEPSDIKFVIDEVGLITADRKADLLTRAKEIYDKYHCDMRIIIINDMREYGYTDIEELSLLLYNEMDMGFGVEKDCVLLFLSMRDRDYDFRVWGANAKRAFSFYGIDTILDRHILPVLKNNNYYEAFSIFLDESVEYFKMAEAGKPFDKKTDPVARKAALRNNLLLITILPVIIALVVCTIWRNQMKTAKIATLAFDYIPDGGFKLTGQTDTFLYRSTSRTLIQSSSSSSSGGGGAGSRSGGSSGRSGKF